MQKPKRQRLKVQQVNPHFDLQPRMAIDHAVVEEYREAIQRGDQMPAVTVFFDGTYFYLVDGFHRLEATKAAGIGEIDAEIHQGDFRAAKLFSLGVNSSHGLKRSSADKRKACLEMLGDDEWAAWSNVSIAKHLKVDDKTVAKYREEAASHPRNSDDSDPDQSPSAALVSSVSGDRPRTVERNGTAYVQKTANLGPQATIREQQKAQADHESATEIAARTDAVAVKPLSLLHTDEHSSPDKYERVPIEQEQSDEQKLIEQLREEVKELQYELGVANEHLKRAIDRNHVLEMAAADDSVKLIEDLQAKLSATEVTRDQYMEKSNELADELKRLKRGRRG